MTGHLVADCHTHLYVEERRLYPFRTVRFRGVDLLKRMDEAGVAVSAVLAHPVKAATLADGAREHDAVHEETAAARDRLAPFGWFSPRWGDAGIAELRRCLSELGFRGIVLDPLDDGFELDDPRLFGVCELAGAHGVPVFVETYLESRGAEPWRLVDLARTFPEVSFIMAHLGGIGLQQDMGGATLAAEVGNIYLETSCAKSDPFAIFEGPARILGAKRILLGSNSPLHHISVNLTSLRLTALSPEDQGLIQGKNLLRLLGHPAGAN